MTRSDENQASLALTNKKGLSDCMYMQADLHLCCSSMALTDSLMAWLMFGLILFIAKIGIHKDL